jgi:glycosyltransferase involved in cell wall biosynthesis
MNGNYLVDTEAFSEKVAGPAQVETATRPVRGRHRLAVFFSHPTQHHSAMFQYLAKKDNVELHVYYYDPGLMGGMFDSGYGTNAAWDVDLTTGVDARLLSNIVRGREVSQFRQVNPGVISAVLKGKYDAVLLSGYASPSNWLVLAMAKLVGSPVWYQSDTNVLDIERKPSSGLKDFLRKIFFRNISLFLLAGDNNKASYRQFGINEDRMIWCPIPVDMARYDQARLDPDLDKKLRTLKGRYGIPDNARVVAFCGKLIERKRPQDIIEALRILRRQNVYGLLIGSGKMESSLREMMTASDQIVITGFVNQSEIPYHMLLADIGVVSSEWDPHPLVTTEFAMCGRPILVSNYCGVWGEHDILRSGENGFVYRCGDASALASRISHLLDNEDLRCSMGERSLTIAESQTAAHVANVLEDLLK